MTRIYALGDGKSFMEDREKLLPGAHHGAVDSRMMIGPRETYGRFDCGNLESERLVVAVDTYEPDGFTDVHAHDAKEQGYLVLSGQAEITVGDESKIVGAGGGALMPAEVPHGFRAIGNERLVIAVLEAG